MFLKINNIINNYRKIRQIKWGIYYIFRNFIKFENLLYNKLKISKNIRRLFITTGNISLINSLAIINKIGSFKNYEDILVIDTGKGQIDFVKKQLEIAKLHNFKRIIVQPRINPGVQLVLNNYFKVDELYILNHPLHLNTVLPLFPKAKVFLIDEGPGSLLNYNSDKVENLESFITHRYINKLDFCNIDDINKIKFEPLDIDEFRKIADSLSKQYPIEIKSSKYDKTILYCGIYWEVSGLDKETFVNVQNETVNNLLNAGYKILYKPHPRDTEFYGLDKNPNVEFINSKFPIELYNLDVLAIVSLSSSTSISPAHYWKIPCFSNVVDDAIKIDKNDKVNIDLIRYIVKEYSPNYKALLNLDVKNTSREELKLKIKGIYNDFLKDKPLLSQNENVKEYIRGMHEIKK